MQRPSRAGCCARQIGKPQLELFGGGFLVEPIPSRPRKLEFTRKPSDTPLFSASGARAYELKSALRITRSANSNRVVHGWPKNGVSLVSSWNSSLRARVLVSTRKPSEKLDCGFLLPWQQYALERDACIRTSSRSQRRWRCWAGSRWPFWHRIRSTTAEPTLRGAAAPRSGQLPRVPRECGDQPQWTLASDWKRFPFTPLAPVQRRDDLRSHRRAASRHPAVPAPLRRPPTRRSSPSTIRCCSD